MREEKSDLEAKSTNYNFKLELILSCLVAPR